MSLSEEYRGSRFAVRGSRFAGYTDARMALAPSADTALRPPLKWAGGKRWQIPHLRPLWEPHAHRRLVEPFCGGLAVALGLRPSAALLNDANPHLINFYRWLQRGLRIQMPMENDEGLFYRYRDRFNELLGHGQDESEEAAALFYYLNRTSFNGLCRFNRQGLFNVPFGRYARIRYIARFLFLPANVLRVELYEPRRGSAAAQARRLRLRGSSLRRAVHALCARRLQLARSRKDRTRAGRSPRSGDPRESSDRSHGELVSIARLRGSFSHGPAPHQLHG